ncbi:MAG: SH3 domain-containing protein [Clostridia bacterium]|nr:SH3 domain-containing protein [Clostridia bacterium]
MKQNGTLNRIISIALLLAMALSLLPVGGAAEAVTTHGYLVINNTSVNRVVNFRRQPNTNDNTNYPIARLPEYWVVEILGQEKGWYKIKANISIQGGEANYQTGYVMENFVKQMTAAEETEWLQNPTAKYQPGVTAAPIVNVTTAPAVTASPTAAQAAGTVIGYVRTVQNDVNLRESPAGKVLNESDKIQLNMVFACYAIVAYGEYDWALVQYKGKAGYIRSDCYIKTDAYGNIISGDGTPIAVLTPTPTPTANPNNNIVPGVTYGTVTTDNVFFRKSMSTSGDSWAKLPMGWQLLVLDVQVKDGITWYKVQGSIPTNPSRTYTGYIHGGFFKINESATATPTAAPANSDYALVILDGVNLRQTPGGTALTAMRINTVVNVLSVPAGNTANDWYYVETSGLYGYLPATSLRVLTTAELSSYVLPAKPTVTGAPTAAPVITGSGYVKLIKDKVNIRKSPAGTVLTPKENEKMPLGTVLAYTEGPVAAGNYNWVKITYNGITGYVRGDCFTYCDKDGNPVSAPTAAPVVTPTPVPGTPTELPTNSPTSTQGYIKLNHGGVNLRTGIWGESIGQLDRGTVLPYFNVVKTSSNSTEIWYEVYSSKLGAFGFILGSMADLCDEYGNPFIPVLPTASPVTVVGYVATTASSVWLRVSPAAGANTAGQVKTKGTVLPMIGPAVVTDYTWYPVQTADGLRGYLRGDYVFELAQWQLDLYNSTGKLATPTPGPATPKPGYSEYLQVMNGALWIRETPSKKANTVGQLPDQTVIKFNKKQDVSNVTWYQVTYNGKTGWVMGTYTRVLTNAEYETIKGTPTPVPTATPKGTVNPADFSDLAMTTSDRVRIRASASMSGKELTMVYNTGTVLTYLGNYTAPTVSNPYYWYNVKYQGVTGWMCGDYVRVLTKAEKSAYQQTGDPDSPQPVTYRTLYKNSTGDDVTRLQQKLVELGYLAADQVSGKYLSSTEAAVIAFQKAKNLVVDGIAGSQTQRALYGTSESGTNLDNNGSSVSVTLYPVEKIDWYNGGIQSIWSVGSVAIITDVYTGISFRAQRLYGDNHADCEPLTTADTAAYCRIYGVATPQEIEDREQELQSYKRRPLWVTIGGRTFAASMYGIPHNYEGDRIPDNGYTGQFCVHFTNSKTHTTNIVDPDASYNGYFGHQSAIKYAYEHSISGTK